jgi:hypothetical protein
MKMHFENREDYVRWATVILLTAMDLRIDHQALDSAHTHAINAANLFFPRDTAPRATRAKDPYQDPPAVRQPPGVRTVGPSVPGQRTTIGGDENADTDNS